MKRKELVKEENERVKETKENKKAGKRDEWIKGKGKQMKEKYMNG